MTPVSNYLDVCRLLEGQALKAFKAAPPLTPFLLEFSTVRAGYIGSTIRESEYDWKRYHDEHATEIQCFPEKSAGETARGIWFFHPGAAWLAARGHSPQFTQELIKAADLYMEQGHRNEDGLFDDPEYPGHLTTETLAAVLPILAWAGKCTGEMKYFEEGVRQTEGLMEKLFDRNTGLWHPGYVPGRADRSMWRSVGRLPLTPLYYPDFVGLLSGVWGRGEGYALFGLSEFLYELPQEHPAKQRLIEIRETMLEALLPLQDRDGIWHQVLNDFGSYPETSGSGWILYAMGRGIKRGTIDREKFLVPYQKGLAALARYIAVDGSVFNGSIRCSCPGGRGTAVDFAMTRWERNDTEVFAPLILALQQAEQIRVFTGLIPSWQELIAKYTDNEGGAK